jgi:hypothetical protein
MVESPAESPARFAPPVWDEVVDLDDMESTDISVDVSVDGEDTEVCFSHRPTLIPSVQKHFQHHAHILFFLGASCQHQHTKQGRTRCAVWVWSVGAIPPASTACCVLLKRTHPAPAHF